MLERFEKRDGTTHPGSGVPNDPSSIPHSSSSQSPFHYCVYEKLKTRPDKRVETADKLGKDS